MNRNMISNLTLICLLLTSQSLICSDSPEAISLKPVFEQAKPFINKSGLLKVAVVGTLIFLAGFSSQIAHPTLPINPVQGLSTLSTEDTQCFAYSESSPSGYFISNVYGPIHQKDEQNAQYRNDAIADIKSKNPRAVIHYVDCRYYNHQPYKKNN